MRALFALLAAASCAGAITLRALEEGPAPQVRTYATVSGTPLRLYVYSPSGGPAPRPAFVWIHGGGWTGGTADAHSAIPRYFASRGMTAFSVEYRLAKAGGPFINDAVTDCRDAVRHIREHASEFGIDPARVAVAGDSAGGHLAGALGTIVATERPNALLLYNGVLDVTDGTWSRWAAPGTAQALSPVFHVAAGAPPSIVLHGPDDTVVSPEQSRRFCDAMRSAGNRCDLVLVEHARHAFVLPDYTAPEPIVVKAIRDGDKFLASLGYVQGRPTLETLAPLPAPRTGAWMARHQQNADRVKQGNIDLVFLGDSITQNYEKTNSPFENFKPTWDYFYGDRRPVNLAISGDTTGNVLWRLENGEFEGLHPKAAVILIGTNDTNHGATAEQTSAGIDEIVKLVHTRSPATKILLLGILPAHISEEKSRMDADVNGYLARHYEKSAFVTYLDVASVFVRDGKVMDELYYDPHLTPPHAPLHPDTVGQHRMAAAIEPVLAKLMGDRCKCEQ